jgi:hypothetical protein
VNVNAVFTTSGTIEHRIKPLHLVPVGKDENRGIGGSGAISGWSFSVSAKTFKEMRTL